MSSFYLLLLLASSLCSLSSGDDSYQNIKSLQDRLLSSSTYSSTIRPVKNQSQLLMVNVSFSLVAIVTLDDVNQQLTTNGFLLLTWHDEMISWNAAEYSDAHRLTPDSKQIWKPRMNLINTLEDRDPFEDDYSHTMVFSNGSVIWAPGGLFYSYCQLEMTKFPFDVQECYIQLCPISLTIEALLFVPDREMNKGFYFPNPGWELLDTKQETREVMVVEGGIFSCPTFTFKLKRRPETIVLNVILPVVLISILNNLVFLIPVESGEKISYAVSVLLSLSVFLSMVSTMTPQVTDKTPALTLYLFILLVSSVITVAASILIVFFHHKDEETEAFIKCKKKFRTSAHKLAQEQSVVSQFELTVEDRDSERPPDKAQEKEPTQKPVILVNRFRLVARHINKVCFVVVQGLWAAATIWYFSEAAS